MLFQSLCIFFFLQLHSVSLLLCQTSQQLVSSEVHTFLFPVWEQSFKERNLRKSWSSLTQQKLSISSLCCLCSELSWITSLQVWWTGRSELRSARRIRSTLQKRSRYCNALHLLLSSFTQGSTLYLGMYLSVRFQVIALVDSWQGEKKSHKARVYILSFCIT